MKQHVIPTGDLLKTWRPFRDVLGFSTIRTKKDYARATAVMNQLLDDVGEDEKHPLADVLDAFRPGRNGWLTSILGGKRVEKILFAATKADHLHHHQHPALTGIMRAMLREALSRADFAGAQTAAISMASLRCTIEETVLREGVSLDAVRGRLLTNGKQAVMYPGQLPSDPTRLLSPAREGAEKWLDADYALMEFAPARVTLRPSEGPPHIRLDRAAEFLIGDRL